MAAIVRLTVLTGPHKSNRYCIRGPSICLVGRSHECQVCLCGTERDQSISRRHCQLFFDSPSVYVRDLGSSNGTYINGHKPRAFEGEACGIFPSDQSVTVAEDGDILTLGGTTLQVHIVDCPLPCGEPVDQSVAWAAQEMVKKDCPIQC
jgi:pSer/pThr/pTyr-binding forkhead associated (FHA) protein